MAPPRSLLLFASLAIAAPAGAAAQSPAERAALESWRDSLAGVKDSVALKTLETTLMNAARRDRENPMLHLQLGFLGYRLGELSTKSHFEDAAGEFEWAAELRPDWPYPWYGLGLAELALGEVAALAVENIRQALGKDYLSKAAAAFARASEADPAFSAAVIDLVTTALSQRIRPRLEVAQAAARLAAAGPAGKHPEVQLARGRVEREMGEADSAVVAFRAALATGGDSGVVLLELARALYFARHPNDGRVAYFTGARAAASVEAVGAYRADLSWVADVDELAAFDGLGNGAARADWLTAFWARRDFTEARAPGERLAEHYRRWAYARRSFRLVSRHRHYDITEVYRSTQADLDDRGVIYMRHGAPDDRATFVCPSADVDSCAPNESWLYHRPDGDLAFHFAARDDVQDFKLVESLVDVLGFSAGVLATGTRSGLVSELYATRIRFGPNYERVARGATRTGTAFVEERGAGRRAIATGTTTDSYTRRFDESLRVVSTEFVAGVSDGGAGERQALHVVFAIPAGRLTPEPAGEVVHYPLRFRLQVADARGGLATVDTFRVFAAPAALERGQYLTGRLAVPVPAGRLRYRLLVETPDGAAGDLVMGDSLDAAPLDGRAPAVSDLVLGRRGAGLAWTPAGDTVLLNPLGTWPEGGTVELYYEVHGLAAGTAYRTAVTIEKAGGGSVFRRLFGGKRPPVSLEFDAVADDAATRVHRAVELGDLARGAYVLTVRVTDPASGATHVRRRLVQVVGGA